MQGKTPPGGTGQFRRNPANEETTVLTPVTDRTDALDRIPLSQRKLWIIGASVLGALLLISLGITAYMWNVTSKWEARVNELVATNYDLGENLATEQEMVLAQQREIDLLSDQLAAAKDKVLTLSDEKAQFGDSQAFATQRINRLTELATTASAVSNALNRCVDGQTQLVEYLRDADKYDASELQAYEQSVKKLCAAAVEANAQLQKALTE